LEFVQVPFDPFHAIFLFPFWLALLVLNYMLVFHLFLVLLWVNNLFLKILAVTYAYLWIYNPFANFMHNNPLHQKVKLVAKESEGDARNPK